MPNVKQLKLKARLTLKGRLPLCAVASALFIATFAVINLCSLVFEYTLIKHTASVYIEIAIGLIATTAELFICAPLGFGIVRWVNFAALGESLSFGEFFYAFSNLKIYCKFIAIKVRYHLIASILSAPLFIASAVCVNIMQSPFAVSQAVIRWLSCGAVAAAILGGIVLVFVELRFTVCEHLLILKPSLRVRDIIRIGTKKLRGKYWQLIYCIASFWGWALLCLTGLAIPFVLPYYLTTLSLFVHKILEGE